MFHPLYWHWLLGGMLLMLLELFIPTFMILWFGLGGLVTGLILLMAPTIPLAWQMLFWLMFSCLFGAFWFIILKPRMTDKTMAGIQQEAILGETGQVIRIPTEETRGIVRFTTPLMGSDEWPFLCDQPVAMGDRVRIIDISGNTLVVSPFSTGGSTT
ncbi:MAG: hypothetical protein CSA22_03180 [Deltaproteobacteria bacterium]|nr:MAG: hypothetical protein CSA22_03180 [Deltaproteobacteria bacterium]